MAALAAAATALLQGTRLGPDTSGRTEGEGEREGWVVEGFHCKTSPRGKLVFSSPLFA